MLEEHGDRMIVGGRPVATAELVAALPEPLRTRRLRLLAGDALRTAGDVAGAARVYQEVAAAEPAGAGHRLAAGSDPLPARRPAPGPGRLRPG
ncbi:hypothetical protein ENC19_22720 [Verrucosispora sp. CWR15]|uniref:Bacterial transcriptional activator domain-containing protein n=1 Tax=Verrucosispora sioxanthis TaxID=2499994 RepID=A0A6M1LAI5_9ACTN|nr:hypothetical protein [Verrucosispora sioxanthis]NEE66151.1 hypothetical protein [Verrucosispora sioxanthis]NGM15261.1 hypothetical protein [Verrucosispora sioxanthis]